LKLRREKEFEIIGYKPYKLRLKTFRLLPQLFVTKFVIEEI